MSNPKPTTYDAMSLRMLAKALDLIEHEAHAARLTPNRTRAHNGDEFNAVLGIGERLRMIANAVHTAQDHYAVIAGARGASYRQIGETLGISKQRAHQRFAHLMEDRPLPLDS